jgi:membrane-associated protease RseP (regulator of RpoE activity)
MPAHTALLLLLVSATFAASPAPALGRVPPAYVVPLLPLIAQSAIQDFWAVIDIRRIGADGAVVLAVTPGGDAERMGLRRGDRIVSINGQPISSTNPPAAALRAATSSADRVLHLQILRDDAPLLLQGNVRPVKPEPAGPDAGCGHVSVSGTPPRASQRIFPAEVTRIDGRSTPLFDVNRHRVDTGRRVLIVNERIDDHRFTTFGLQERQRQLTRQGARRYKVLIVDVEPNTRYEIGARLVSATPEVQAIRENTYWEPVVWRKTAEPCR